MRYYAIINKDDFYLTVKDGVLQNPVLAFDTHADLAAYSLGQTKRLMSLTAKEVRVYLGKCLRVASDRRVFGASTDDIVYYMIDRYEEDARAEDCS